MTREEAIEVFEKYKANAIALQKYEVNAVLDKIRAEIEEYRDSLPWESNSIVKWDAINYILEQIIDKYMAESEGSNADSN